MDVAGPTWLGTQHTDRVRRAAQEEAARRCRELEFRVTPQAPLPPRFRLVVFAVSTFGSFGSEAQRFLAEVGRRCGTALPVSLLPQATWAVGVCLCVCMPPRCSGAVVAVSVRASLLLRTCVRARTRMPVWWICLWWGL